MEVQLLTRHLVADESDYTQTQERSSLYRTDSAGGWVGILNIDVDAGSYHGLMLFRGGYRCAENG